MNNFSIFSEVILWFTPYRTGFICEKLVGGASSTILGCSVSQIFGTFRYIQERAINTTLNQIFSLCRFSEGSDFVVSAFWATNSCLKKELKFFASYNIASDPICVLSLEFWKRFGNCRAFYAMFYLQTITKFISASVMFVSDA